jgi:hypothetical protein
VDHPYVDLPPHAYWRTGVAEPDAMEISGLWRPKFAITPDDKTVTAGSCFAQHISRALREHGFRWMDFEAPPSMLSEDAARRFGYGTYSFRTGNIYTTPLLRQWVRWALGREEPDSEHWEQDGRFFDPLRPQVEPDGFGSPDELLRAREVTLTAIRKALRRADVFVFTLGLTEGWRNAETGLRYASCPGTVAGEFDPARHEFVNDGYREVHRAMTDVIRMARRVNPGLRFLLTVSPVPLTATASGEHVLVSTTYSKSTLRAVAGDLAQAHDNVDYFPSYEVITSAPYRSQFFEPNLRSVRPEGVAHVMTQFFSGLRTVGVDVPAAGTPQVAPPVPAAPPVAPLGAADADDADDVVCEDELLDYFNAH